MNLSPPCLSGPLLRDASTGCWLAFGPPLEIFETFCATDVLSLLRAVESAVEKQSLYAVGALAYEAAPGFDPSLMVSRNVPDVPLVWFGLFGAPRIVAPPEPPTLTALSEAPWRTALSPGAYRAAFGHIKRCIREGDAYQVNLTYRLRAAVAEPPFSLFARLAAAQRPAYAVFLPTPGWTLCSVSPELLFSLDGDRIESRPMKGTAPRGLSLGEDRRCAATLLSSEKDRAENVMIVDMVRNDLGRIALTGSIEVPDLFAIEKYPTVWQMTSLVRGHTHAPVSEILAALFPAASITGAPKSSAMRIIADIESEPRGFYTGAAGFLVPGRRAQFNVAIRSLLIGANGQAEYGTGGGIVWDSECVNEQSECRTKTRILSETPEPFSLLETMLWTPEKGVFLLDFHLARLADSAEYFDFALDSETVRRQIEDLATGLPKHPHRIRLLVSEDGAAAFETAPFSPPAPETVLRVRLASFPVARDDPFLYHKTTRRRVYERALATCPGFDDVLLFNDDGDVTESTRANVIVQIDGKRYTPPVSCGLLPGTLRRQLVEAGEVAERIITVDEIKHADAVFLANSLRGIQRARVTWP